jgi:glucose/mannose transport system substrate-binding protein
MDICAQEGIKIMKISRASCLIPEMLISPDTNGADAVTKIWNNNQSVEDAAKALAAAADLIPATT